MSQDFIIDTFSQERGFTAQQIFSNERNPDIWYTRYMIWYYLHVSHNVSANKLSRLFNRNRPSIFRGIRIMKHHLSYYKDVRDQYDAIVAKIEGAEN